MASFEKAKSGKWRAIVYVDKKRQTKQGFKTKREAEKWAADMQAGVIKKNKYENMLLSEYFEEFISTYKSDLATATRYQYQNTLDNLIKYIPKARLVDFTRTDFQRFINEFGKGRKKETVAKRKNRLTQALKSAFADGIISKDPTVMVSLTGEQGKKKEDKYLEADELAKLDRYVQFKLDHYPHATSYLAILIAIHTGMRIGEIKALTADDVDFEKKTININKAMNQYGKITTTKTVSSNRVISIDDKLLSRLEGIEGPIAKVSNYGITKTLHKAISDTGIKEVSFHALRHSHGSLLVSQGVDIKYVSKRLGHRDIATTIKTYTHLLSVQEKEEQSKSTDIMSHTFGKV
ncbi:Integrase/recombinase [Fructobacillus fructosus]|uniref:tyrosine-type recombinase/integrase n=1 Tax=Fructobacillus fructosus TaxID=1631 RepID=UPI002DB3E332|nr:Integrase/recombinase [Fructobacillus fructosus]